MKPEIIKDFDIDKYLDWYEKVSLIVNIDDFKNLIQERLEKYHKLAVWLMNRGINPLINTKSVDCALKIAKRAISEAKELNFIETYPPEQYWFPNSEAWNMIKTARKNFINVDIEGIQHATNLTSNKDGFIKEKLKESTTSNLRFCNDILNGRPVMLGGDNSKILADFVSDLNKIDLIKWLSYELAENTELEAEKSKTRKILTHPQKVILLEKLKFFELEQLRNIGQRDKEKIIALLLGEDETNTRKYINALQKKTSTSNYNPYKNEANEKVVNELLKNLG